MNSYNENCNNELFEMLNNNKKKVPTSNVNYKIDTVNSKKFYKAKIRKQKQVAKGVITLAIGTVVIFSSSLIINKNNKSIVSEEIISETSYSNIDDYIETTNYIDLKKNNVDFNNVSIQQVKNEKVFSVGNSDNIDYIKNYMNSSEYEYFIKYSNMYGVDPQVMVAMAMQESWLSHEKCIPTGENYNNCAIGIMQLESNCNNNVTAYNYEIGDYETAQYSDKELCDIEKNIQVGCMRFQNAIKKYDGNIYLAVQAHNYGENLVNDAIELTSKDENIDVESLKKDYQNTDWLKYIDDIHFNPLKYTSNWNYNTYGDNEYLLKVMSNCVSSEVSYKMDDKNITFDLEYATYNETNIKHR